MSKYIVALAVPAIIAGAVRYPVEGPFTVSYDEAKRLSKAKVLDGDPEEIEPEDGGEAAGDGLDKLKVADLDKIIADEGVEIDASANKAAKVAAIRTKREASQE